MSASVRDRADDQQIELGTEINWPPIYAALVLVGGVVTAVLVLFLLSATHGVPGKAQSPARPLVALAKENPKDLSILQEAPEPLPAPSVFATVVGTEPIPDVPERLPPPKVFVAEPTKVPAMPQHVKAPAPAPAPVAVVQLIPVVPPPTMKHRFPYTEEKLRERLWSDARELDVEREKGTTANLLKEDARAHKDTPGQQSRPAPILELIAQRADLKGLPVRNDSDCKASAKEAGMMQEVSRIVRTAVLLKSRGQGVDRSQGEVLQRDAEVVNYLDKRLSRSLWREDVGMRLLVQMLQSESIPMRLQLVKMLAASPKKSTSAALVQRAVFDLSPEVREAAVKVLKERPRAEYRSLLLEAFRYPWAPAADHAAEALVALEDREAIGDLEKLLDQPDPQGPTQEKDKKWMVAELVRVNHLGNCLLCHAPSSAKDDPVRGVVPMRGKRLPQLYYESRSGDFVRADVTYLKQDFSVVLPVAEHLPWPEQQRFDFLVRKRELSADEMAQRNPATLAEKSPFYPQSESVLWALRELKGRDMSIRNED
jgi:hypothetical protein